MVGFNEANLDGTCGVSVNNDYKAIKPGEFIAIKSRGRDCKVILEGCKYGFEMPAKFRLVCAAQ